MDYVVIGGDERYVHLARLLKERGKRVGLWGREAPPDIREAEDAALGETGCLIAGCPAKARGGLVTPEELLGRMGGEARLALCGPGHPGTGDGRVIDLWADEALVRENAELTAEGAIAAAMRASTRAVRDLSCLVVGWGRIGRALTERLVALGARVTVASRRTRGRNGAVERGAEAVDTGDVGETMRGFDLAFNTSPERVLDDAALARARQGAMVVDLSSPPYGVDLDAAWRLGLRAWREPGLPGRYCPESAALALLKAMERQGLV